MVIQEMSLQERNQSIYDIHKAFPDWTYEYIGQLFGISRQRAYQIVCQIEKRGIIDNNMEPKNNYRLNGEPISPSQAARETGIPHWTIERWAQRGLVRVLEHPGHACTGKPVLLDPVTLQKRIDRYRPRPRRNLTKV